MTAAREVRTFCPLCVSRCGARAEVIDGAFIALKPDPDHPTGAALCVKGKAAPEIVTHPDRLLHPLKRTTPKGSPDPGWQRISWDEALDAVASRLNAIKRAHGAESVVFGNSTPAATAISDSLDWFTRLRRAFGSPNNMAYMELCGWCRYMALIYTYGEAVPAVYMPDLERAGSILFWGYNPSVSRLVHATATTAALRRGACLVVVDPRRAGLASKADQWLRVRPGTDCALALAMTHVMVENSWYDAEFCRRWTNAPFLVRADTGLLLRADAVIPDGKRDQFVAWDAVAGEPVVYDPSSGYSVDEERLALRGEFQVSVTINCRPVFDLMAEECARMAPENAAEITGVPAVQIADTARLLWESRPVAFYMWSGLEQQSSATQTARAIGQLYALTGSFDGPGGNVRFAAPSTNRVDGLGLLPAEQQEKAIGVEQRPLGPAHFEYVNGEDFYAAALYGVPYRARALVNLGANVVMAHGDSTRGRDALAALDFFVHADLFMSPTAEEADIVLPAASAWEKEALRIGFEVSQAAQSHVQLRPQVVPPPGEARSDLRIIFDLATRLGLGEHFFDGDIDAAWRHQLAPSGVTLDQLRTSPGGVSLPLVTQHRKYAVSNGGVPAGFPTLSRKIELFSETLADHGYPPLPVYEEPSISPRSRPDLAAEYPLILSCAKSLFFCQSQHREIASLRKSHPDPIVEIHPDTAATRGITAGDWVRLATPNGSIRARAKLNINLDPNVVFGQHGWWQPGPEAGMPGYPVFGPDSANLNLVLKQGPSDTISGSSPLRASVCQISLQDAHMDGA